MTAGERVPDLTLPLRALTACQRLMATTALVVVPIALAPVPASADSFTVRDGAAEVVDGIGNGTQPSPWAVSAHLFVGGTGNGSLSIVNGGRISTGAETHVGFSPTGSGQGALTVSGPGSTLDTFGGVHVTNGTMTISDGGVVNASVAGGNGSAIGTAGHASVLVTGEGSVWNVGTDTAFGPRSIGIGESGTGILTISEGGKVAADRVYVAYFGGSGILNIGAAAGDAASDAGTLDVAALSFGSNKGTLVFNHSSTEYEFAAAMSGAGVISHLSGETVLSGDNSGFTGTATVDGGVLTVQNEFGSALKVNSSGELVLDGATVIASVAGVSNGVVNVSGGVASIIDSTIVNDITTTYGNAVVANGDATITIANSHLTSHAVGPASHSLSAGVYARQQSNISINGGSVRTTGDFAYGIRTADEGQITANGVDIVTEGDRGYGVQAFGVNTGAGTSVTLVGGSVTTDSEGYAPGIQVSGVNGTVNVSGGTEITTKGAASFGLVVDRGGHSELDDVQISTSGDEAAGMLAYRWAGDVDSTINGEDVSITTVGDYAAGVLVGSTDGIGGASVDLTNSHVRTEGLWSHGLHAFGVGGTDVNEITFTGGSITTANAKGQFTQDGDGSRAYAIWAQGEGAVIKASGTDIRTYGQRAYGAYATAGGIVDLANVDIETDGFMAYGIYASGGGSVITAENVNITTNGQVGDAAWAYSGGRLDIVGGTYLINGSVNPIAGEASNGLIAVGGIDGVGDGIIHARDLTITTEGGSSGLRAGALIGSNRTSGTIYLSDSIVTVNGAESQALEASFGSVVEVANSELTSTLGAGIVLNESATLSLDDVTLVSASESIRSSLTQSGQAQTIRVGGASQIVSNNGTLLLVERSEDGADGEVELVLEAGSVSRGDILDLDERTSGFTDVTVEEGASWTGVLRGVRNFFAAGEVDAEFEEDVAFDGEFVTEAGSNYTFAGNAEFGDQVVASGSTFNFSPGTQVTLNDNIQSVASVFVFDATSSTNIAGSIGAESSVFAFSAVGSTRIGGDVGLKNGSRTSGGTVTTPIEVSGSVVIDSTSILGGNWSIDTDLTNSGRLALGNSIGVATIGGDATFEIGSIFDVEIAGGGNTPGVHNDFLEVKGAATINGGTVTVSALDPRSSYTRDTVYTILTARDGVDGMFDAEAVSKSIFIDPTLSYDDNNVYLTIAVADDALSGIVVTPNQRQAARALDGLEQTGDAVAVYNAIIDASTSEAEARRIIDLASGQVHASAQHVIDRSFRQFSRTLSQQGASGFGGLTANDAAAVPLPYAPTMAGSADALAAFDGLVSHDDDRRLQQAWLAPIGGGGSIAGDGNAAGLDWWGAGLAGGYEGEIDVAVGQAFGGFGLGYIRAHSATNGIASTVDTDTFQAGLYGGWRDGPWTFNGSLAYGASHQTTNRHIVFGSIDRTATSDYWSHSVGFSGEAGYGIAVSSATTVSPLATLDIGWSGHGGYTESGAGALNLTGSAQGHTNVDTGLGIALQHSVPTDKGQLTFQGRVVWEHAFAGAVANQSQVLEGSPTGFSIGGPGVGQDRLRLGAGLDWAVSDAVTLRAHYDGLFSSNEQSHGASLGLKANF